MNKLANKNLYINDQVRREIRFTSTRLIYANNNRTFLRNKTPVSIMKFSAINQQFIHIFIFPTPSANFYSILRYMALSLDDFLASKTKLNLFRFIF